MVTATRLAIFGGIIGIVTIIACRFKLYINRAADGQCDIILGKLDKPFLITKEE